MFFNTFSVLQEISSLNNIIPFSGILDPTSIFEIALVGLYLVTGLLHPSEMMILVHGLLYYVSVPSAFILLMVYRYPCNIVLVVIGIDKGFNE